MAIRDLAAICPPADVAFVTHSGALKGFVLPAHTPEYYGQG